MSTSSGRGRQSWEVSVSCLYHTIIGEVPQGFFDLYRFKKEAAVENPLEVKVWGSLLPNHPFSNAKGLKINSSNAVKVMIPCSRQSSAHTTNRDRVLSLMYLASPALDMNHLSCSRIPLFGL